MPPDFNERSLAVKRAAESRLMAESPGYLDRVRASAASLSVRDTDPSDAGAALAAVEELGVLDLDVPTVSRIPAARLVKAAVKSLIGFYLRYFGRQLEAFGEAVSRLGGILLERTEKVERSVSGLEAELRGLADRVERLEREGPRPP